jgi:hypothetical protein
LTSYDPSLEALKILTDTYWTPQGWRSSRAWPAPDRLAVAEAAGIMFSAPRTEDHDGWVDAARTAAAVTHLKMLKGNKAEREILIGILGVCGILGTAEHPGYAKSFIRSCDREIPGRRFVDQEYPACWWTAADGINAEALETFLPRLS